MTEKNGMHITWRTQQAGRKVIGLDFQFAADADADAGRAERPLFPQTKQL